MVSPGVFIPIAEEQNLDSAIGLQAIEAACDYISIMESQQGGAIPLSVNISANQLLDSDFDLYSALDHSRDQAGRCLALRGYNRCFARIGGAAPVDLPPACGEAR